MAGGFGGDDPQGYGEDPEITDEDLMMEDEDDDEDDDEEESEDLVAGMTKEEFEAEERNLTKQLKEMMPKFGVGTPTTGTKKLPIYTPHEKTVLDGARRHPKLKSTIKQIEDKMKEVRKNLVVKIFNGLISVIMTLLPVILVALLILGAIGGIYYLFSYLFPSDDGTPPVGNSINGITGVDFYGIRTWYRDNTLARGELVREYVQILEDSVNAISTTNGYSVEVLVDDGKTPTVDNYDYTKFDVESFSNNYPTLSGYVTDVAMEIYSLDNEGAAAPSGLNDTLDGIKYFGLLEDARDLVAGYINTNYKFLNSDSEVVDVAVLDTDITLTARTEKLFVKDYVLNGDTAKVSGIDKLDYVGFTFMAKRGVVIEDVSMFVSYMSDGFEFALLNNGVDVGITKTDEFATDTATQYTYETDTDMNVGAYNYVKLTENSDNVSLFELVHNGTHADLLAENEGVQTIKTDTGLVGTFTNTSGEAFLFIENKLEWR